MQVTCQARQILFIKLDFSEVHTSLDFYESFEPDNFTSKI